MSIVHELGFFFHTTRQTRSSSYTFAAAWWYRTYISTYHLLWMGRQGRSRSQAGNVGVSSEKERERERSRIEMQLEEVRGRDSWWLMGVWMVGERVHIRSTYHLMSIIPGMISRSCSAVSQLSSLCAFTPRFFLHTSRGLYSPDATRAVVPSGASLAYLLFHQQRNPSPVQRGMDCWTLQLLFFNRRIRRTIWLALVMNEDDAHQKKIKTKPNFGRSILE